MENLSNLMVNLEKNKKSQIDNDLSKTILFLFILY